MVNDGKIIGPNAYTNEYNKPNVKLGTMTLFEDGQVTVQYINDIKELHKPYIWSFGGLALYPAYDPVYEPATNDWLKETNHTGMGYANGKMYLIVSKKCEMRKFRERIRQTFGISAISLDGGGSTQMFVPGGGMKSSVNRKIPSIIGIKNFHKIKVNIKSK